MRFGYSFLKVIYIYIELVAGRGMGRGGGGGGGAYYAVRLQADLVAIVLCN